MAEIIIRTHVGELVALTTKQCMTKQEYLQEDGRFRKLSMARSGA